MSWFSYLLASREIRRERKLKQMVCPHEFKRTLVIESEVFDTRVIIYCPVCQLEKKVSTNRWDRIDARQRARERYEKEDY